MSWKDRLRPASFRGVRFHVDDRQHQTGRRLAIHEYPKRDKPFPEDMGKATRRWSVNAYVIGDDYMSRRDALLKAGERAGSGTYVDFWTGSHKVVCEHVELRETNHQGRYASISLGLIEAGEDLGLTGTVATAVGLAASAAGLAGAAAQAFSLGTATLSGAASSLSSLSGVIGQAGSLVSQVSSVASRASGLTGSLGQVSSTLSQASSAVRTATAVGRTVASHFK